MATIDNEAINLIRQQIEAEHRVAEEKKRQNDLAEKALLLAQERDRSREVAERNRTQLLINSNEKLTGLVEMLPQVFLTIYGINEALAEIARRIDRIDEVILILLTGRGNGNKDRVEELKGELHRERLTRQHLKQLKSLLADGFSESELRTFCYDEADFRQVYYDLSHATGKAEIVNKIIEYAEMRKLTDRLLKWVEANNPARFKEYMEG